MTVKRRFLSSLAVRRIEKMLTAVSAHPETINQNKFPTSVGDCATQFCGAGHLIFQNAPKTFARLLKQHSDYMHCSCDSLPAWDIEALKILQLDPTNACADRVFQTVSTWPTKFHRLYRESYALKTPKAQAKRRLKAFVAYWRYIIKTDGECLRSPLPPWTTAE